MIIGQMAICFRAALMRIGKAVGSRVNDEYECL